MQYLFNVWGNLKTRLLRAKHILLCADFDGTITPIKPRPQEAKLSKSIRLLLCKIAKAKPFTVGIISGRSLKDIKEKVDVGGLIYAGNHGLEIACKGKKFIYPAAERFIPLILKIAKKLSRELAAFPEIVLEEKQLSLSLHYRLVSKAKFLRLKEIFFQIVGPYLVSQKIKLTFGKKVWELRPPIEWDKGKAILWLLKRLKTKRILAIYIGDDRTDEDAFRAVNKLKGISIFVGRKRKSLAGYYLKSTKDTERFLARILAVKT